MADKFTRWLLWLPLPLAVVFSPDLRLFGAAWVLFLSAACVLLRGLHRKQGEGWRPGDLLLPVVFFYFGIRALVSPVLDLGMRDLQLILGGTLMALMTREGTDKDLAAILRGGWVIGALSVAIAIYQAMGNADMSLFYGVRPTVRHPSGLSGHYNHFANFVGALGVISFAKGLTSRSWRGRLAWGILTLLLYGGVFLSQSRGGVIAVGCGSLVVLGAWFFWGEAKRGGISKLLMALAVVTLLILIIQFGSQAAQAILKDRVGSRGGVDVSDGGRFAFAQVALDVATLKPWFGSGARAFSYESFRFWDPDQLWAGAGDIGMVHNEPLQVAADYGLVGLILLCAFVGTAFVRAASGCLIDRGSELTGLRIAAVGAMVTMLVQSQFSFIFHTLPDVMLFGVLVGITGRGAGRQLRDGGRSWAAVGCCVVALVASVKPAAAWWHLFGPGGDSAEERLATAREAHPDYELFFKSAALEVDALNASREDAAPGEDAGKRLEKAVAYLDASLLRHPWNFISIVTRARLLDRLGRFKEAEDDYRRALPLLDVREIHYKTHYYLSMHYLTMADQRWRRTGYARDMERNAGEARALFEEALYHAKRSKELGTGKLADQAIRDATGGIEFFKEARVEATPYDRIGGQSGRK